MLRKMISESDLQTLNQEGKIEKNKRSLNNVPDAGFKYSETCVKLPF